MIYLDSILLFYVFMFTMGSFITGLDHSNKEITRWVSGVLGTGGLVIIATKIAAYIV